MTERIPTLLKSLRVAAAVLAAVAVLAWSTPADAQSAPFGGHKQRYAEGVLKPGGGQGELDRQTAAFYAKWKAAYLRAGCRAGRHYVKADTDSGAAVVSEGQGYGMLIVAMMAGEEPDARAIFDGLYRYYLDHPSEVDPDLMAWAQDADCKNILGPSSATDGDLDAAYALLLAHRQWGSKGAIDYLAGAERVLKALMRSNVTKRTKLPNLGDWVKVSGPKYRFATRSSDWMPGHFRAFAERDDDWKGVLKASQRTAAQLQSGYAPATGLLPDFVIDTDTAAKPAPRGFLEGANDGRYGYNACRDPWRFGVDAAIDGDEASAKVARKMSRWARRAASNKPAKLRDGYELDGSPTVQYQSMAFVAPFAVAATVDPDAQKWLDALWDAMVTTAPEGYYPDSIRMLSMLAVSRNWLRP
ncbi:glycosyl hydrolase family 8 [Hansschlegelia zhihuaiae]|uniref:cellulase n=1 Tax=Hansschlegelia zhihuaiae TaxID=405005 RepID=A0A4Q0MJ78_9HYPH|nr:glycosyl hydrolase family 8 [Hansschlegelia zhihuaiae]RXF73757.1 chitosanase [Hansschlegelia zhihuaiae]